MTPSYFYYVLVCSVVSQITSMILECITQFFSRGVNFRFCATFSSRENNIHWECNFAKLSSREIFFPRIFLPRENKIQIVV